MAPAQPTNEARDNIVLESVWADLHISFKHKPS